MATKYPNLAAEIARSGISYGDVYATAAGSVGKTADTASNWVSGRAGEMPVVAAFAIRDQFFPQLSIDYLFSTKHI